MRKSLRRLTMTSSCALLRAQTGRSSPDLSESMSVSLLPQLAAAHYHTVSIFDVFFPLRIYVDGQLGMIPMHAD